MNFRIIRKHHLLALISAVLLTACGGGGGGSSPRVASTPVPTPTPESTPTPVPTPSPVPTPTPESTPTPIATPTPPFIIQRENNLTCIPPTPVFTPGELGVEAAFPNLPSTQGVLSMVQALGDSSRWYLGARNGVVYSVLNESTADSFDTVLDIQAKVSTQGERGLTGLAMHPDYPTDNRIFVLYNDVNNGGRSTISSFTVNTETLEAGAEQELLHVQPPNTPFHNGGDLSFGLDGYLYASLGDDDDGSQSQDNTNLRGTIIRLDISSVPYAIPASNPFSSNAELCTDGLSSGSECPEIYAYGLRNPWRMSIDKQTGELWVGDVGDSRIEEVDRVINGGNYGWPYKEGTICTISPDCDNADLIDPVAEYGRDLGASVVGGYVYRGSTFPELVGKYLFKDVFQDSVYSIDADAPQGGAMQLELRAGGFIAAMAQANNGDIYFLNASPDDAGGDDIYIMTGGGASSVEMPERLSDTGCFNSANKESAIGVFDYEINSQLWSDGAAKTRAFALPDNTTIDLADDGDFIFPENSILIKHFLDGSTYLETRLFIRHPEPLGWQGYSYQWNSAQNEATLVTGDTSIDMDSTNFTHTIPTRSQCSTCHTEAAGFSLGIETKQLNRVAGGETFNQVDILHTAGYLSEEPSDMDTLLYRLDDNAASEEQRARSYLHSNCSGCHRPGGNRISDLDLRFDTPFSDTGTCNVDPALSDLGVNNAKRIAPGLPNESVILLRMMAENNDRMPPLGSNVVHTGASDLFTTWISSLSSCP